MELDDPQVLIAMVVGGLLTVVGVIGLILQPFRGFLFGLFGVNLLHNLIHLVTGLLGVGAAYAATGRYAREYNVSMSIIYFLVFIGGMAIPLVITVLNANIADNALHFILAFALAVVAFGVTGDESDDWDGVDAEVDVDTGFDGGGGE